MLDVVAPQVERVALLRVIGMPVVHGGDAALDVVQFFLNRKRFMRVEAGLSHALASSATGRFYCEIGPIVTPSVTPNRKDAPQGRPNPLTLLVGGDGIEPPTSCV